jgi:uncharacterized protein
MIMNIRFIFYCIYFFLFLFALQTNVYAMEEATKNELTLKGNFASLSEELILYTGWPKETLYKNIVQKLPIALKFAQLNTYFHNLFTPEIKKYNAVNAYDANGYTPLIIAIENNNIEEVMRLIKNGADINKPGKRFSSITPLHYAIGLKDEKDGLPIVRLLLEHGADCQGRTASNSIFAPFARAIHDDKFKIAQLLIDHGVDVTCMFVNNAKTSVTPLGFAKFYNKQQAIDLIINVLNKQSQ